MQLYPQRADAENVFDELKNQWGFAGFCSQKATVSQSSARILLLVYNLWSLFVRVLKNQGGHTEAITSREGQMMGWIGVWFGHPGKDARSTAHGGSVKIRL